MARSDRFRHEAILYAGPDEFVAATAPALHAAVERDEPVFVVVDQPKIALLRSALGSRADGIRFADMRMVGHNPARIIPEWRAFVDEHAGWRGTIHGIGEPIWSGRTSTALVECRHHEALLNLAFADDFSFCVQCPLDVAALPASVADEAHRTHPFLWRNGELRATDAHRRLDPARVFEDPLTDAPPGQVRELKFDGRSLVGVRRLVARHAAAAGLDEAAVRDLVLAADELATNSVRHGGGSGTLRAWVDHDTVVCEVIDRGHIVDPLVGRRRPRPSDIGGRGLWMANQLCDLVQIRSTSGKTVVRLHKHLP
jgi:anti-sigma regulatory factor (Ser/Thr protein kinase)